MPKSLPSKAIATASATETSVGRYHPPTNTTIVNSGRGLKLLLVEHLEVGIVDIAQPHIGRASLLCGKERRWPCATVCPDPPTAPGDLDDDAARNPAQDWSAFPM